MALTMSASTWDAFNLCLNLLKLAIAKGRHPIINLVLRIANECLVSVVLQA